jgi:hypothetical protein
LAVRERALRINYFGNFTKERGALEVEVPIIKKAESAKIDFKERNLSRLLEMH